MTAMDQDPEEWEQVFQELIREVKPWHNWTLVIDKELLPNVLQQGWTQFQQKTFARFRCSSCFRSWSSAKVQVLFHVHWSKKKHRGQVKMRVFSQRCKKCTKSRFEVPELMPENIKRTLTNLVFSILKKCYKEGFKPMEELPAIKDTSLEGPHDSLNCEACLQGFCAQSGGNLAPQSSVPSLLSTPSEDTGMPRVITIYSRRHCSPPPKVDKLHVSTMTPKDLNLPKAQSKASQTSKSSAALTYPTKEVSPTLTVTPKVPNPLKVDPKASHTSKPLGTLRILPEEVLPTLTVTPKVSNPLKVDPKDSHTSKPLGTLRILPKEVLPTLTMTSEVPNPLKVDPKASHTSKPLGTLRILPEEVSPTLTMTSKVPNPLKVDPKASHTSEPLGTLRILPEEVSPTLTVTPKVPNPLKVDPKASHTSKQLSTPRTPTEEVPPILTLSKPLSFPKLTPGSAILHAPKPSATPRCPRKETPLTLTVTSMEDKVLTQLGTQVPSPTHSRTESDTTALDTRVTIGEVPPTSQWSSRSKWERGGSSWNQGREVDSGVPMIPTRSEPPSYRFYPQGGGDRGCCSQGGDRCCCSQGGDPCCCCSQACEHPGCYNQGCDPCCCCSQAHEHPGCCCCCLLLFLGAWWCL